MKEILAGAVLIVALFAIAGLVERYTRKWR